MRMRWNWKNWQALVQERVTDADALKLATVWPGYAHEVRNEMERVAKQQRNVPPYKGRI